MAYKKGENRRQRVLFPECIDEYVGQDAPVRFFDAFVDSLDMEKLGFIRSTPASSTKKNRKTLINSHLRFFFCAIAPHLHPRTIFSYFF